MDVFFQVLANLSTVFATMDSLDINASHSGSRLLSLESPNFQSDSSHSRTGPGGDDLSLSELSLDPDSIMKQIK